MPRYRLTVNGAVRTVEAEPDTPLLWVLRDTLGLTGTKYGCGVGACGSCLVLRDGDTVLSCQVTIAAAAGGSYTTIEGLSPDGGHPVQRAWIAEDVAQCGYCQPAMILRTVALLRVRREPTDAEIDAALGEVVCRCGTYPRLRRAVRRAASEAGAR